MPRVTDAVRMYAPEQWGQLDRFIKFAGTTYRFSDRDRRAVSGVHAHYMKAVRLHALARRLRPNIEIDEQQLEERGFTPAENAAEIVTVIEAAILELYSTIDCTAKVLRAVYGPQTRGFTESTRKLFQAPERIGGFPEPLRALIASAAWYPGLLYLRDELTHLDTGHVHLDGDTRLVRYAHFEMRQAGKPFIIEDIFGWLDTLFDTLNAFLGAIFHHLNGTLRDDETQQLCGIAGGRMLWRYVRPSEALTFNDGRCGAWIWFDEPDAPASCPFVEVCGAYANKAPRPVEGAPRSPAP